jgi:ketosteroid isomerase-like protein
VAFSWTTAEGERASWAQVLTLRDARIVRMQDYRDPAKALESIRRL